MGKYFFLFPVTLASMHNWDEWCLHDQVSNHYIPPSWCSWNTGLFSVHAWVLVQILFPVYKWNIWIMSRLINWPQSYSKFVSKQRFNLKLDRHGFMRARHFWIPTCSFLAFSLSYKGKNGWTQNERQFFFLTSVSLLSTFSEKIQLFHNTEQGSVFPFLYKCLMNATSVVHW